MESLMHLTWQSMEEGYTRGDIMKDNTLCKCVCGGDPVTYKQGEIVIIRCSNCGQFVSWYGSPEQARVEWTLRMKHVVREGKHNG